MSKLVADIGATNARFAGVDDDGELGEHVILPTERMTSAIDLVRAAMLRLDVLRPDGVCLAVAGPVREGKARITNHGALFDAAELTAALGVTVVLVNDFVALAHAVPELTALRQIGGGTGDGGAKALIGPGSGCGMAILVPLAGAYRVLPSEGGHADLAISSPLEAELWGALSRRVPHVCWEAVLSGPGLVNLHAALCEVWGVGVDAKTAAEISAAGVEAADPICHQTLELFFGFLGGAAGNLAVTTLATGGVYIGGGIVPRLADFAASSPMRRRFDERGMLTDVIREVPLYLVLDELPGLKGALRYLQLRG